MNRNTAASIAISSIFISMAIAAVAGMAADSFALLTLVGFFVSLNLIVWA